MCTLRRMSDGNFTGTRVLPNGAVTKSNVVIVDSSATSYQGKVQFHKLILKGDIGVVYFIDATCQGHPGITVSGNVTVGPCAPGEALDATRSCKECPENTYSPRGESCMECPPGGNCTLEEWLTTGVKVTAGVATPYTKEGYWLKEAPTHMSEYDPKGYCDFYLGQCVPGEKEVIVKRRDALTKSVYEERVCRPVNEVGNEIHDSESLFHCVEKLKFYRCPLGPIACAAGQSDPMLSSCNSGYRGPKCALCDVNHWKTADDTCVVCADMGGKTNARVLYGLMGLVACMFLSFLLNLYLSEDNGAGVIKYFHKKICCGCQHHERCWMKYCHHAGKAAIKARMKRDATKTTASAVQGVQWFRPEKFKILLSFVQIFSQVKQNYGVPWPSAISDYMRALAFFNLDLFNLAAMDCIVSSNYFMGLMVVTAMPVIGGIILVGLLNYGRSSYIEKLDKNPRKCVLCHHPVKEFMSPLTVLELRYRNMQKGLVEHALNPEAGLPSKFECSKCGSMNARAKVIEKFGPDIMKWKCK